MINAGDGKHEHPSQALLDIYTLRRRAGDIDGKNIWIVGDVLHSRVARSGIQAFRKMGAQVTLCGPPALIPRDIEAALGCDVRHDLDDLAEADVVYALRMQRERMRESYMPSVREYVARYQIDSRRLGHRQLLMHPGPVNRGVELSPEVIDGPSSLIGEQVEAGLYMRMAILFEVLAGPRERAATVTTSSKLRRRSASPREADREPGLAGRRRPPGCSGHRRSARARPPHRHRRHARLVIRNGEIAELAAAGTADLRTPSGSTPTACSWSRLLRPARPPADPGGEEEEDVETGTRAAAAGGYCGIVAMANTNPPVDTPEAIEALRERAGAEASVPSGFLATVTREMKGEELTDMVEIAEAGAVGFSDDGLPIASARVMRRALQYQGIAGRQIALHEEDPELSGAGVMHEGEVSARSAWPESPRSRSRR